jgi:hypothetical protein
LWKSYVIYVEDLRREPMLVTVRWRIAPEDSDVWDYRRVLYAYFAVDDKEILYIGKAGRQTVRQRRTRSAKKTFWDDLEKERNIHETIVRVGEIRLEEGRKLSRELLLDAESLLVKRLRPWGNIRSRSSRISRPGLRVRCEGDWPLERCEFYDVG